MNTHVNQAEFTWSS